MLGDPAATARLRATGRAGLYLHFNALPPALSAGRLGAVYDAFRGTGEAVAEIGYGFLANPGYIDHYADYYTGLGQAPWAALANAPDDFVQNVTQTLASWQMQAEAGRRLGIHLLVPVTAPNDNVAVGEDPASAPSFALMRQVAQAMGGVAIDAPPNYVFLGNSEGPRYRDWLVRWVHWATGQGLMVFWIVSPDTSGDRFLVDTQKLVAYLGEHDALPHIWVVENYGFFNEVEGADVTAPGSGYTRATVTVSAPTAQGGVQALARATVKDGKVTQVDIVDPGAGYMAADLAIAGDGHGAAATARVVPSGGPARVPISAAPAQPNPNFVGRETLPESVVGVALWMAEHAPVRPGAATLAAAKGGACGG
jgi:hypothetical protein